MGESVRGHVVAEQLHLHLVPQPGRFGDLEAAWIGDPREIAELGMIAIGHRDDAALFPALELIAADATSLLLMALHESPRNKNSAYAMLRRRYRALIERDIDMTDELARAVIADMTISSTAFPGQPPMLPAENNRDA